MSPVSPKIAAFVSPITTGYFGDLAATG